MPAYLITETQLSHPVLCRTLISLHGEQSWKHAEMFSPMEMTSSSLNCTWILSSQARKTTGNQNVNNNQVGIGISLKRDGGCE